MGIAEATVLQAYSILAVMEQRYVLHVLDMDGLPVKVSTFYVPSSLHAMALIGHLFHKDGCTVTITDEGRIPPKEYRIDEIGRLIPI